MDLVSCTFTCANTQEIANVYNQLHCETTTFPRLVILDVRNNMELQPYDCVIMIKYGCN